jgi:hypothetical protein
LVCAELEEGDEPGPLRRICPELIADDRLDRYAGGCVGPGQPHLDVWDQCADELVRYHDGVAQPDHGKDKLDILHLWLRGGDYPLDRHRYVLLRRSVFGRCGAASIRLRDHPLDLCVLQHLRGEHGATVQESGTVEGLPIWGTGVHRAELDSQDSLGVADFCRNAGPGLETCPLFRI